MTAPSVEIRDMTPSGHLPNSDRRASELGLFAQTGRASLAGMADRVAPSVRSRIMAAVRSRDTGPELALRRALHRLGYRYRINVRALPGSPDLVFPSRRKVIFVHGCFWHGHRCKADKMPRSNVTFWTAKIAENRRRDIRARRKLQSQGWGSIVVWECELRSMKRVEKRVERFLARPIMQLSGSSLQRKNRC